MHRRSSNLVLLGIPLPHFQSSSASDNPYVSTGQEEVESKDNNCESRVANTVDMIDNYSESDPNSNPSTGDENPISRTVDPNVNNDSWASNNNPIEDTEGYKEEKFNNLFCSLCHTPCYDTAAMEIHLAQHCEVQVWCVRLETFLILLFERLTLGVTTVARVLAALLS